MEKITTRMLSNWQQQWLCAPFGHPISLDGCFQVSGENLVARYIAACTGFKPFNVERCRVYFTDKIYLTRREYECVCALLKYTRIPGAAKSLNLSPRTIEFHLISIKKKLNCSTKVELLRLLKSFPGM